MSAETNIPEPEATVEVRPSQAHTKAQKTGPEQMSANPQTQAENSSGGRPRDNHGIAIKAARTRRLNKKLGPLQNLDRLVADVNTRVENGALDRSDARILLQGLALRKDIILAMLRVTEVDRKLEEFDVRAEFEELKRAIGFTS
jgi:hypothetical protein